MKTALNTGQIEIIPQLIKEGMTPLQIAKRYNCHVSTVRSWIRKLKQVGYVIPPTPTGRPKTKLRPYNEKN
jgi:transposase